MNTDQDLLKLLQENSRRTVSDIAKKMGLSRATVQHKMERLERTGVIQGYTIKINPILERQNVSAYVMISVVPKKNNPIVRQLLRIPQMEMLCTISGQYDMIAKITESTTQILDQTLDKIANLDGVEKTLSHIVLSRKIDR
jgi:DNA-binding Lrp family transcriptional regulator